MSNRFASLPLQKKVSLTLALTMSAFAALSYVVLSGVITPAFKELELKSARSDLLRAEQAISTDIENLVAIAGDWALWDDIYYYVQGSNPAFAASNLERPTLDNLNLSLMAVYATDDRLLWADLVAKEQHQNLDTLGILDANHPAAQHLTSHDQLTDTTVGIVDTRLGPMIIVARPILKSDDSGPIAGSLVMGQFLNEAKMRRMQERTDVDMRWMPIEAFAAHSDLDPVKFRMTQRLVQAEADTIAGYTILTDILQQPVLVLQTNTPRAISALGARSVTAALLFMVIAGILVTVVMWFLLRRTIVKPIHKLSHYMRRIRKSGDLSQSVHLDSSDEVGELANQFNGLTSEVHEARKALLFQSFKAGKADTAAEVLHNIRNAMTPLINGVERLSRSFKVGDDLRVRDAVEQLQDRNCPPERAVKLFEYISASFERVKSVNAEARDDMKIIISQARQIEAIMLDQEKFANETPIAESIAVREVIGEAAHVIPKEAAGKIDVEIDPCIDDYRVHAHRIGLLQVLGNLILNAYESIQRASREHGRILLSASQELIGDKPMVRLTVRDNGTGFDDDVRNRVFQRGYTSKGEGDTTGLGLHWCANAVAGMGGRIAAESNGADKGAKFHVLLPVAPGG